MGTLPNLWKEKSIWSQDINHIRDVCITSVCSVCPPRFPECVVLCKPVVSQGGWECLMGPFLVFVQNVGSTALRFFWNSVKFNKRSATQNTAHTSNAHPRTLKCSSAHENAQTLFISYDARQKLLNKFVSELSSRDQHAELS